jgi:hypothetical protein
MYFKDFPVLPYPFYIGDQRSYAIARNVLRRVGFTDRINERAAFIEYDIKDGERPEHIANRIYGNPQYHWIILLANNIIDPYHGWYKPQTVMENYIQRVYNSIAVYFTDRNDKFAYDSAFESGCTLSQSGILSSITKYRDTFCEFSVADPSFIEGNAEVQKPNGTTAGIKIQRVLPSYIGVHHFTVERPTDADGSNGAQEFPIVDPLTKQSPDYEETGTVVGTRIPVSLVGGVTGATVEFWETFIGRYMGVSGSEVNTYAISNFKYEQDENEKKRTIKILAPQFLSQALKELKIALGV